MIAIILLDARFKCNKFNTCVDDLTASIKFVFNLERWMHGERRLNIYDDSASARSYSAAARAGLTEEPTSVTCEHCSEVVTQEEENHLEVVKIYFINKMTFSSLTSLSSPELCEIPRKGDGKCFQGEGERRQDVRHLSRRRLGEEARLEEEVWDPLALQPRLLPRLHQDLETQQLVRRWNIEVRRICKCSSSARCS